MRSPQFRRFLFSLLVLGAPQLLSAQTNAPAAAPVDRPPPPGVSVLHDVVIGKGGDRDLHAEIAFPTKATGPLPAVIYVHGGGWFKGSYKVAPYIDLAKVGYFAASIEYRLDDVAKWPAQIEDCKLGVRWLRANAAKYNIDPNRIGVWGDSAGGHLVVCLGTMTDPKFEGTGGYPGVSSAVQAVVDFYGPTDFYTPGLYAAPSIKMIEKLIGVPSAQNPALWKSASPLAYVAAGDPPMLIVQGDSDTTVPMTQSTELDAALTQVGVPHQLVIVKNAEHGFKPVNGATIDPDRGQIRKLVYAFLDKNLKTLAP
jgi:acetyl esterase/lipase